VFIEEVHNSYHNFVVLVVADSWDSLDSDRMAVLALDVLDTLEEAADNGEGVEDSC
jgi:hypothetical protein